MTNVVALAAGYYHSLALQGDGTVVAWGYNNFGQTNVPNGLTNVVVLAAGSYHNLALLGDGRMVTWGSSSFGQTNSPARLTNAVAVAGGSYHSLALESDGSPAISVQPFSQTVSANTTVRLQALAAGLQPLGYQWQYGGTNIPGATNALLTLTNVQSDAAGAYALRVSNSMGTTVSVSAVLAVVSPPIITVQPEGQTVVAGAPVVFTVEAEGSAPLGYQWHFNSVEIPGATDSSYSLLSVQLTNAGTYAVVVSNALGTAVSSNATLAAVLPPIITTQPSGQTSPAGATVDFAVQADSSVPAEYQWYFNQTNLLLEAVAATVSLTNVQPVHAGDYFVVVKNVAGSVPSAVATLTVLASMTC